MCLGVFGLKRMSINSLFFQLKDHCEGKSQRFLGNFKDYLLAFLFFLKNYPTFKCFSFVFDKSPTNLWDIFLEMLEICWKWAKTKVYMPNYSKRAEDSCQFFDGQKVVIAIDCVEQTVVAATDKVDEDACFSGKYMDHTFTLLVGCSPKNGKVIFVSKSMKGKTNDINVCHSTEFWTSLCEDECIIADGGFTGLDNYHLAIIKHHYTSQNMNQVDANNEIDRIRVIIENVFGFVQKFKIAGDKLRFKTKSRSKTAEEALELHNKIWLCLFAFLNEFGCLRKF